MAVSRARYVGDRCFYLLCLAAALVVLGAAGTMVARMTMAAWPALRTLGLHLLTQATWNPAGAQFGALALLWGTLYSSLIALTLAVPLAIGIALYLTQWAPRALHTLLGALVELLAAIPSVVYGLWGIWALVPRVRGFEVQMALHAAQLGPLGVFFSGAPYGFGLLSAALLLELMILPTITAIARDVMATVPRHQWESAFALGATRWEAARLVVLRSARAGLIGAVVLGFGRALGETMAVTMVIGNQAHLSLSLFSPSQTIASAIANEFNEARSPLHVAALLEIGLLLFVVTAFVTLAARAWVRRLAGATHGLR